MIDSDSTMHCFRIAFIGRKDNHHTIAYYISYKPSFFLRCQQHTMGEHGIKPPHSTVLFIFR